MTLMSFPMIVWVVLEVLRLTLLAGQFTAETRTMLELGGYE